MKPFTEGGVANGVNPFSDAETGNESEKRVIEKSLKMQQRELKRIVRSQKSLKNATKNIIKLMKVHDHTTNWSMVDQSKTASKRGSAAFIQAQVTTADPNNFKS